LEDWQIWRIFRNREVETRVAILKAAYIGVVSSPQAPPGGRADGEKRVATEPPRRRKDHTGGDLSGWLAARRASLYQSQFRHEKVGGVSTKFEADCAR
jgi:hypothetical protein